MLSSCVPVSFLRWEEDTLRALSPCNTCDQLRLVVYGSLNRVTIAAVFQKACSKSVYQTYDDAYCAHPGFNEGKSV
jgi:hypothetical protein